MSPALYSLLMQRAIPESPSAPRANNLCRRPIFYVSLVQRLTKITRATVFFRNSSHLPENKRQMNAACFHHRQHLLYHRFMHPFATIEMHALLQSN